MVAYSHVLTLLAATVSLASPAPVSDAAGFSLEARADQIYICKSGNNNNGKVKYGEVSYDKAVEYFREAGTTPGKSGYPKEFRNLGNVMTFPQGCNQDVWELPLLANGKRYDYNKKKGGNEPGPIRVYYTKNLMFCAIGAKENANGSGNPHNCQKK
ncbi:hypothetical protein EsDP_00003277 [Epichloe bromicola]|uniref:Uncharacterized protein n=1 Tax=Epichloe bromicola TaxID=79588 RepID=A0ABQ0CN92_9HYPO